MPLANTYACPVTSGTTRVDVCGAAAAGVGAGPGACCEAANVKVAEANRRTRTTPITRGARAPRRVAMVCVFGTRALGVELSREGHDGGRLGDHRENRRGCGRRRVLPAERGARERLEPGKALGVCRGTSQLKVEVRAGRVPGLADEPGGLAGGERRALDDGGLERGEMAVRPLLAVPGLHREP